jgi:hypothetical protein
MQFEQLVADEQTEQPVVHAMHTELLEYNPLGHTVRQLCRYNDVPLLQLKHTEELEQLVQG